MTVQFLQPTEVSPTALELWAGGKIAWNDLEHTLAVHKMFVLLCLLLAMYFNSNLSFSFT